MAKRTAIIDIGSNSARLVIFEKTSRYGFHLICEQKSKVRIGEGAYEKEGHLQPIGIKRAFLTLQSFLHTIQKYQAHKTLCVATSALRDAPNGKLFVKWIQRELGLPIKIIDGNREAKYGAIAANNLLPINEGITIDIGGGSSDMALIQNSHISDTYSLNLGTVRLKELFFDKEMPLQEINKKAKAYIRNEQNRYDTIREGALIFNEILTFIGAQTVVTSSVGVREGVFLEQLLRDDNLKFPNSINPSITSILDRFNPLDNIEKKKKSKLKIASKLYAQLQIDIKDGYQYESELLWALKLSSIGKTLTIYKSHQHAFYIAMQELNYGFTHKQMLLTSLLLRMHGKELLHKPLFQSFEPLLPQKQTLLWLSFIYTLTVFLHEASNSAHIEFNYHNKTLIITSDKPLYLAKEKIKALEKPVPFAIIIEDESKVPRNKELGI
jgi:exopolyphosphatase/pppGpp-phosphohydrolase